MYCNCIFVACGLTAPKQLFLLVKVELTFIMLVVVQCIICYELIISWCKILHSWCKILLLKSNESCKINNLLNCRCTKRPKSKIVKCTLELKDGVCVNVKNNNIRLWQNEGRSRKRKQRPKVQRTKEKCFKVRLGALNPSTSAHTHAPLNTTHTHTVHTLMLNSRSPSSTCMVHFLLSLSDDFLRGAPDAAEHSRWWWSRILLLMRLPLLSLELLVMCLDHIELGQWRSQEEQWPPTSLTPAYRNTLQLNLSFFPLWKHFFSSLYQLWI